MKEFGSIGWCCAERMEILSAPPTYLQPDQEQASYYIQGPRSRPLQKNKKMLKSKSGAKITAKPISNFNYLY